MILMWPTVPPKLIHPNLNQNFKASLNEGFTVMLYFSAHSNALSPIGIF